MADINITINEEDKPIDENSEEAKSLVEEIADEIQDEDSEEVEIDDKWLSSKFDAVESRMQEIAQSLNQLKESLPMESLMTISGLSAKVEELTNLLAQATIQKAEIVAEIIQTPNPPLEAPIVEAEINPENVDDQREVPESLRPKRRGI